MEPENKVFSSIEADLDSTLVKHILQQNSKKDGVLPQLHSKIGVEWVKETSSNTTSIKLKGDFTKIQQAHEFLSRVINGKKVGNISSPGKKDDTKKSNVKEKAENVAVDKDDKKTSKVKSGTKETTEKDKNATKSSEKKDKKATKTDQDINEKTFDVKAKAKESVEKDKPATEAPVIKETKAKEADEDINVESTEMTPAQLTVQPDTKRIKSPLVKEMNLVLQPVKKRPKSPIAKEMNLYLKYDKDWTKKSNPTETELNVEPDIMSYVANVCRGKLERIEKLHRVLFYWEDGGNTVSFRSDIRIHNANVQVGVEAFKTLYDEASTGLACSKIDRLQHGMTAAMVKKECEKLQDMFPMAHIKEFNGTCYVYGKAHDVKEARTRLLKYRRQNRMNWMNGMKQGNNISVTDARPGLTNFKNIDISTAKPFGQQLPGSLPRHNARHGLDRSKYRFPLRREAPISLNASKLTGNKYTTPRFPKKEVPENNFQGVVSCRQIGLSHRMYFEILTSLDAKISIYQGDVIKEDVDVIVNETNDRLKLSGELAWALAQHGGHEIEADCRRYVATHGRLTATQVVPTTAGQLPSKHILHAVIPHWVSSEPRQSKMLLFRTYENIFKCAAIKMRVASIALSLQTSVSTGIPKDVYAETMFQAVVAFLKAHGPLLKDIRMVNPSHRTVSTFIDAFKTKMPLVNFVANSRSIEKWH